MKTLRRLSAVMLAVILTLLCIVTVSAESVAYKLPDLKMSISLPDTMIVETMYEDGSSLDPSGTTYLEAITPDGALSIFVSMVQNEKTLELGSFAEFDRQALQSYKSDMLQNDGYIDCTEGEYGGVLFLDFSQKYSTEQGVVIYGKQSVTLVGGKNIFITSQSVGDSFTSDELTLIKSCLESIKFNSTKNPADKFNPWPIIITVLVVILLLILGFVALSFYMGKKNAKERAYDRRERRKEADYDVLRRAEQKKEAPAQKGQVRGYKSSSDYFEENFETAPPRQVRQDSSGLVPRKPSASQQFVTGLKRVVTALGSAFAHMGYFFKNLSRLIKKKHSSGKGSKKKNRPAPKSRDYDVFRDR
ncbi:MAG: hypothetical protein ACI4GZ_03365 [Ruminococcus sp.]